MEWPIPEASFIAKIESTRTFNKFISHDPRHELYRFLNYTLEFRDDAHYEIPRRCIFKKQKFGCSLNE